MGYDSTVSVYNEDGRYMGNVINDVSINSVRELIIYSRDKQLSDKKLDKLFMFGDINCDIKIMKDFLDDMDMSDIEENVSKNWLVNRCKKIVKNDNIKYFSITSV